MSAMGRLGKWMAAGVLVLFVLGLHQLEQGHRTADLENLEMPCGARLLPATRWRGPIPRMWITCGAITACNMTKAGFLWIMS